MKSFDSTYTSLEELAFQRQLHLCRDAFEKAKIITPSLVVIKLHEKSIPCYIDQLDNGMELMFFPDESSFAYSIMNSMNEDPDLLFTNAWTIDFLYKKCEETDLYISEGKNLCFRNIPGCLPSKITTTDMGFLYLCLQQITYAFENIHLPCLADQRVGYIEHFTYHDEDFDIKETIYASSLTHQDHIRLSTIPHTNEHIILSMLALPYADSEYTKQLHIRFIAQTKHNQKEMDISLHSMEGIAEQLVSFFLELFKERGIPEAFHIHNKNIANILSPLCEELGIVCILNTASCEFGELVLQMLLQQADAKDKFLQKKGKTTFPHVFQSSSSSMKKAKHSVLS